MNCKNCNQPIKQPAKGRRRRYCSTACRRAIEFAIRRLDRHLHRLEENEEQIRRHIELGLLKRDDGKLKYIYWQGDQATDALASSQSEIEAKRAEMLAFIQSTED